MNFTEWHEKYYPNEAKETIHKMSHAWASSKVETLVSQMKDDTNPECKVCDGRTDYFNLPHCPGCGRKLSRDPLTGMGPDLENLNICGDKWR